MYAHVFDGESELKSVLLRLTIRNLCSGSYWRKYEARS